MHNLNYIIKCIENRNDIFAKYHIEYLAVFGSMSRGEATAQSDVDILVQFNQPVGTEYIDLADDLESILKIKVDLVSKNAIKPKYFSLIKNDLKYIYAK